MLVEDEIGKFKDVVGQKLVNVSARGNTLWFYFEKDVFILRYPDFTIRCLDCAQKFEPVD